MQIGTYNFLLSPKLVFVKFNTELNKWNHKSTDVSKINDSLLATNRHNDPSKDLIQ